MMEKSIARNLTKKIYHSLTPKSTSLSSLKMIPCSYPKQCKIGVRSYSKMIIHHSHSYTESSSKWRKALLYPPVSQERMSMLNAIKVLPLILIINFKSFHQIFTGKTTPIKMIESRKCRMGMEIHLCLRRNENKIRQ